MMALQASLTGSTRRPPALRWTLALLPLVLLGVLLWVITSAGASRLLSGDGFPPVERLSFQRVTLAPDEIAITVLNDGPDPVTIAQVAVDDAFWAFEVEPSATAARLEQVHVRIPYPWVHGETHAVRLLTSTGATFDHVIGVAVSTPRPSGRFFAIFTLIGLYVGVVPVTIGLLWFPFLGGLGRRGLDYLLALTVGLLAFLLVDGTTDGLEAAAGVPGSLQGVTLLVAGVAAAWLALDAVGAWLRTRRAARDAEASDGWVLALLVAIGIGLHNFGEGLAIGSAFALGEAALGSLLIVGFTLHNTTEGLAIVAPMARESAGRRVPVARLVQLGCIGGAPTILGAWIGGFVYSPVWAVLLLALGVGAIGQVTVQILRQSAGEGGVARHLAKAPVLAGLATGVIVMYTTGLLVG